MEKDKINWSQAVTNFSQQTTFHGVRYIGEDTRFLSRRIAWVIIVVAVIVTFSYAIVNRVLYFYDYPSNIELEVGYVDKIPFPAVTVCNQNPYRMTALQRYGLFDMVRSRYKTKSSRSTSVTDDTACIETYVLNPVVCNLPVTTIYTEAHIETTVTVCKELCTLHVPDKCSGFLFDDVSHTCTLTSFTGEDQMWFTKEESKEAQQDCSRNKMHFYRKQRCTDNRRIQCNFEDDSSDDGVTIYSDNCRFNHDPTQLEKWVKVMGKDNTYNKDSGHYLQLFETETRPGFRARIQTEYFDTTDKCISLYAALLGEKWKLGKIEIKAQAEFLVETKIKALSDADFQDPNGWLSNAFEFYQRGTWIVRYAHLPRGLHRIIIEGTRVQDGSGGMRIDDIVISDCSDFKKNCVSTPRGTEYMGNISTASDGQECVSWGYYFDLLNAQFEDNNVLFPDSVTSASNYCRQTLLENMGDAPLCITQSFELKTCNIQTCACTADEFKCTDGMCVSWQQTCDGTSHCIDNSDEGSVCEFKMNITCDFEDQYICGYRQLNLFGLYSWMKTYDSSVDILTGNAHSLQLSITDDAFPGETPIIISTIAYYNFSQILRFDLRMLENAQHNDISIWIIGSLGVSHEPIMSYRNNSFVKDVRETSSTGWLQYDLCIPGGTDVYHSIIFQALYNKPDTFAIDNINVTGIPCDLNLLDKDINLILPLNTSVDCTFDTGKCSFTAIADHMELQWVYLYEETSAKALSIFQSNDVIPRECSSCISYKEEQYNFVYFESEGFITSPGFPSNYQNFEYSKWLIEMPNDFIIKLEFKMMDIEYDATCQWDNLVIEDPVTGNVTTYCGTNLPAPHITTANIAVLTFISDIFGTLKGFQIKYSAIPNSNLRGDSVLALMYKGAYSEQLYKSRLLSPVLPKQTAMCLTLKYLRTTPILVSLLDIMQNNVTLFNDRLINIYDPIWTSLSIDIPETEEPSMVSITGQKTGSGYLQYSVMLNDITVNEGSCMQHNYHAVSTITCDFENVNQCNYFDASKTTERWTRETFEKHNGEESTVMFYKGESAISKASSAILVSSKFSNTEISCLQFQLGVSVSNQYSFMIQLDDNTSMLTLDNKSIVIDLWNPTYTVDTYYYKVHNSLQYTIPTGVFGVLIYIWRPDISGNVEYAYIDDVILTTGACNSVPNHFCSHDQFQCLSGTCIPLNNRCDKFTQCEDNSDEDPGGISNCSYPEHEPPEVLNTVYTSQSPSSDVNEDVTTKETISFFTGISLDRITETMPQIENTATLETIKTDTVSSASTSHKYSMAAAEVTSHRNVITKAIYDQWTSPLTEQSTEMSTYVKTDTTKVNTDVTMPNVDVTQSGTDVTYSNTGIMHPDIDVTQANADTNRTHLHTNAYEQNTMSLDSHTTSGPHVHITQLYISDADVTDRLMSEIDGDYKMFLHDVSYHQDNMILECVWNGLQCDSNMIVDTITDMGLCFTFNPFVNHTQRLQAERTGQQNGLRLTLNVEDYERVEDIGSDSGIKIHFYDQSEMPIMRSRGYAVGPGERALFSLKYTTSTFLEPPYGTCGNKPMPLYPDTNYTTSHCLTICDMNSLIDRCGCILPYMSADTNHTHLCTLQEYLSCFLDKNETVFIKTSCDCPDACEQTQYDVQLSESALSGLAVNSLLGDKQEHVQSQYNYAMNQHHRLNRYYFDFISTLKESNKKLYNMQRFMEINSNLITSLIEKASTNIIEMTMSDIDVSSRYLEKLHDFYFDNFHNERMYVSKLTEQLFTSLQQLTYQIKWEYNPCVTWYRDIDTIQALLEKVDGIEEMYIRADKAIHRYAAVYKCDIDSHKKNTSECVETTDFSKLHIPHFAGFNQSVNFTFPKKTVLDQHMSLQCKSFMSDWHQNIALLRDMIEVLRKFLPNYEREKTCNHFTIDMKAINEANNYSGQLETPNAPDINVTFDEILLGIFASGSNQSKYMAHFNSFPEGVFDYWHAVHIAELIESKFKSMNTVVKYCFSEFGDFLSNSVRWRKNLSLSFAYNVGTFNIDTKGIEKWLETLYQKYTQNVIDKVEFVNMLMGKSNALSLSNIKDVISSLGNSYQYNLILPLYTNIDMLKEDILQIYENIIENFVGYTEYMGKAVDDDGIRLMQILMKPKPELNRGSYSFLRNHEQVEGFIGMDIQDFFSGTAFNYIADAVNNYFLVIEKGFDEHYTEYIEFENDLLTSVTDLESYVESYKTELEIHSQFIKNNIMKVDVYFGELKYSQTMQKRQYSVGDFFSDLGGYLGLLLGASIVTVCEVLDLIIYSIAKSYQGKRRKSPELEYKSSGKSSDPALNTSDNATKPSDFGKFI